MARKGTKRVKNESSADERESDGEHEDKKARLEQPSKDDGQASGAASTSTSAAAAAASANGGGERKELFEMDGEYVGSISSNRRVAVRDFKNKLYVDIRETYEKDGKTLPGKKGITLTPEQWSAVKSYMSSVDDKLQQLGK